MSHRTRLLLGIVVGAILSIALAAPRAPSQIIIRNSADPDNQVDPNATVNWIDTMGYDKPAFVSVAMPNEATATKYYVDLSAGTDGASCGTGTSSPCRTLRGLADRNLSGLRGNAADAAAYVYLRGSGTFYLYNNVFAGTPGKEIVVKPWGTATVTSSGMGSLGYDTGTDRVHDVIIDGGPNLAIKFVSNVGGSGPNYSLHVNASNVTIYRVQSYATGTGNNLFAISDFSAVFDNIKIINSEFYACNQGSGYQCAAVYIGPCNCNGSCGATNVLIQNNIMRDMGGEAIEINPRVASSGITVTGNEIRNAGKQTCGGAWDCRPAVAINGPSCGGSTSNVTVTNNLMWDIGGSCIWSGGGGGSQQFSHNTCYDYAKGTASGVCQQGICGGTAATVQNNIIYATNGTNPFDGTSFTASHNLCGSSESCGTSSQAWSAATVLATDGGVNHLRIGASSEARNTGTTLGSVTTDYRGTARPQESASDIGAFEYR